MAHAHSTRTHDTHAHATHAHDTRTCTQLHARTRTHARTFTRSTRSLHRPACCLQSVVESADARMDPRAAQEQHRAEGQPRTVEAGHNAARMAATLAAASMPVNTWDGHQLAYSSFCERPVPPLLQLLPPGPALQTHVSLEERCSWLHPFPRGVQLPADGVVLPPLPDWLTVGEPSEPTEPQAAILPATVPFKAGQPRGQAEGRAAG